MSDSKKLKLIEKALGRNLKPSEISILLDVIHTLPSPGTDMAMEDGANYQIKYFLAKSILDKNNFDKLYREGVFTSKVKFLSPEEMQQKSILAKNLGLTNLEVNLLDQYSADLYYDINQNKDYLSVQRQLLHAVTKLPIFEGIVYRAIKTKYAAEMITGKKIKSNSFWSTSSNKNVAQEWQENGVVLIIETNTARSLGPFARYPNEAEQLIPPNTSFEVTNRIENQIYLRETID